ncbi:MAG: hypothetical protein ACYDDZ_13460, partial [Acidimicrobiales bacterium]
MTMRVCMVMVHVVNVGRGRPGSGQGVDASARAGPWRPLGHHRSGFPSSDAENEVQQLPVGH